MNMTDQDCPSPEAMGRLAAGELEPEERARILDHAVTCVTCGQEIALFRPLRAWAAESATVLAGRRRSVVGGRTGGRFANALLPAAAVVFLAIGTALWLRPIEWPSGELRQIGPVEEELAWSMDPPAGATLPEPPRVLELRLGTASADATYEFQLFDHELAVVWRSGQHDQPRVELPEEVRRQLEAGETYSWRVVMDDGLERRSSSLADFVVAP